MKQFKHELLRKNLLFLYSIAGVGALDLGLFRPILQVELKIENYSMIALFLIPGFILFIISSHYLKNNRYLL